MKKKYIIPIALVIIAAACIFGGKVVVDGIEARNLAESKDATKVTATPTPTTSYAPVVISTPKPSPSNTPAVIIPTPKPSKAPDVTITTEGDVTTITPNWDKPEPVTETPPPSVKVTPSQVPADVNMGGSGGGDVSDIPANDQEATPTPAPSPEAPPTSPPPPPPSADEPHKDGDISEDGTLMWVRGEWISVDLAGGYHEDGGKQIGY